MPGGLRVALLLGPALAVIAVLFLGGLAVALMRSLRYLPSAGLDRPDLGAYAAVLASPDFLRSFLLTFHIAFTSTLLSAVLGVGAALLLRRRFAGRAAVGFLFRLNLTVPHAVGAIGILSLFAQSGTFARLAYHAGLIDGPADFPALVYDPFAVGIIAQYVWKEVPFIGVLALAQMQALGEDHEAVARTLGAGRGQAFRHVLLPLILPGVVRASAVVFAFAFGAYEIPALLGQSHPAALPVLAYRSYTDPDLAARPEAMAMAVVIAVLSAAIVGVALRFARGARG